jgi:RimJ/RimL family protein N-acetyltransferase
MDIKLRPFVRTDFDRLIAWIDSPDLLAQWAGTMAFTYPLDEAQLDAYLLSAGGETPPRRIFTALNARTKQPVGHVELNRIDRIHQSASVSRLLVGERRRRGKGIGGHIIEALLDVAFGEMAMHRIDLYVLEFNLAAIRLYEGLGFVTEGHMLEARNVGGAFHNVYYMALLRSAWHERRGQATRA